MVKKYKSTQELVNIYPAYTKVRSDDQSVGYQTLNAFAAPMDYMTTQLSRMQSNNFLSTRNIDEIDLLYRVTLPTSFEFTYDTSDPINPYPVEPVVSGYANEEWYRLTLSTKNNVRDFWYESIPSRVSLGEVVSGVTYELISETAENFPVSGEFDHHLGGGKIIVETTGGIQYLTVEDQELLRGKVVLTGKTRKGTIESETIIFPWDMKQPSAKEWQQLTQVDVYDMEDSVSIDISSADFVAGPYLSHYNLRFADTRNKVDEFYDLGWESGTPTLDLVGYISDEWQQLVLGFSNKEVKKSWELVDESYVNVSGVDLAVQPFTDRIWVVDDNNYLYLYDLEDSIVSGINLIKGGTAGAHVQFEVDTPTVVLGQDISILPWHARPLKEIKKYRIWYQTPSGTKYGLLDGSTVAYSSNFWVVGVQTLTRTVTDTIFLTAAERGDYLFVIEVIFIDDEEQTYKRVVPVNFKLPLAQFDLSSLIPNQIDGIEFDSDQQLWIKSQDDVYRINIHFDNMLIDYTNKVIYLREEYDQVDVEI